MSDDKNITGDLLGAAKFKLDEGADGCAPPDTTWPARWATTR